MFTNENWRYLSMRCAIFSAFFTLQCEECVVSTWKHCTRFDLTIKNTRMNTKSQTQYFVRSFDLFMRSYVLLGVSHTIFVCVRVSFPDAINVCLRHTLMPLCWTPSIFWPALLFPITARVQPKKNQCVSKFRYTNTLWIWIFSNDILEIFLNFSNIIVIQGSAEILSIILTLKFTRYWRLITF